MNIWHISDTHCLHNQLDIPSGIDMIIHSGDCSNTSDSGKNANEVLNFLDWFANLPIQYKLFIGGNHDVSIERRLITPDCIRQLGIIYLENEMAHVAGYNIWGSPYTPSFGTGWAWNIARHKTHNLWVNIPEQTEVLITHGPPKGILDLSEDRNGNLEMCGCKSLAKKTLEIKPMISCFGHIHNHKDIVNAGLTKLSSHDTIYSNASCVVDGKMELVNHGNLLILPTAKL